MKASALKQSLAIALAGPLALAPASVHAEITFDAVFPPVSAWAGTDTPAQTFVLSDIEAIAVQPAPRRAAQAVQRVARPAAMPQPVRTMRSGITQSPWLIGTFR